jgi:putative transposase
MLIRQPLSYISPIPQEEKTMTAQTNAAPVVSRKRKSRIKRSTEQWQALVDQYEASGLTQKAFCKQHGIAVSGLNKWRKRLSNSVQADFVDITHQLSEAGSQSGAQPDRRWQVELQLGQGLVLRIGRV